MRILLIAPHSPRLSGAWQRTKLLSEALSRHGDVQTLLTVRSDRPVDEQDQIALNATWIVRVGGWSERWLAFLGLAAALFGRATGHRSRATRVMHPAARRLDWRGYDVVVCRYASTARSLGVVRFGQPAVLDIDDWDLSLLEARRHGTRGWPRLKVAAKIKLRELVYPEIFRSVACVLVSNSSDLQRVPYGPRVWLPNIPFFARSRSDADQLMENADGILFVGDHGYEPNREGLRWYLSEVWPGVLAREPKAVLRVVGLGIDADWREELARHRSVEVVGVVTDLTDVYAISRFAIVPILTGGGTHIKLIEAYRYLRPTVTTVHGHRGYEEHLRAGEVVMVARSAGEMVEHCLELLQSPTKARALASRGQRAVDRYFSRDTFESKVAEALKLATARAAERPSWEPGLKARTT